MTSQDANCQPNTSWAETVGWTPERRIASRFQAAQTSAGAFDSSLKAMTLALENLERSTAAFYELMPKPL